MKKMVLYFASAALLVLTVIHVQGGQLGAAASDNQVYEVKIDNFRFGPQTLTVPVGTTVTWVNQDDVPHTVVSAASKEFKSPPLDTDQEFSYQFAKAGTYAYYCSLHPKMIGTVFVTAPDGRMP